MTKQGSGKGPPASMDEAIRASNHLLLSSGVGARYGGVGEASSAIILINEVVFVSFSGDITPQLEEAAVLLADVVATWTL